MKQDVDEYILDMVVDGIARSALQYSQFLAFLAVYFALFEGCRIFLQPPIEPFVSLLSKEAPMS